MRIVIAGGHGRIALLLSRLLADAGHDPVGLIRNADHHRDVVDAGATPVLLDLESSSVGQVAEVLAGAHAAVFAAGAGPDSGAERKRTVDRDGAILLADAAVSAGVSTFVIVSSMGADGGDENSDDIFEVYLWAKGAADAAVRERDLEWTVIRPGGLTDDPPTGKVTLGERVDRGSIPRADVAALIAEVLQSGIAARTQFEAVSGETPIPEALRSVG